MTTTTEQKSRAPGELELVRRFVNTYDVEEHTDELSDPDAMRAWLKASGLPVTRVTAADVERAVTMREALRALLFANAGDPVDRKTIEELNEIAGRSKLAVQFESTGDGRLEAAERDGDAALGELLAIVYRSMADGTWRRLKACREDTCQWAFYDRSKNRSGTWCSMAVCGNRAKARAYRHRHGGG